MPVRIFDSTRDSPFKARAITTSGSVASAQRRPFAVPQSSKPLPDPKEVFLARYYAHITAKAQLLPVHKVVTEPVAGVSTPKKYQPKTKPTLQQKRQDFLQRHRRFQEERRQNHILKEEESARKAREFVERWKRLNGEGKVIPVQDGSHTPTINTTSSTNDLERNLSSSSVPTLFSSEGSNYAPSLSSSHTSVLPSPSTPCYETLLDGEESMTPSEWKEYAQWIKGYVLYSRNVPPALMNDDNEDDYRPGGCGRDAWERANRLGVHYRESAVAGRPCMISCVY